jgi:hypothetical protein
MLPLMLDVLQRFPYHQAVEVKDANQNKYFPDAISRALAPTNKFLA